MLSPFAAKLHEDHANMRKILGVLENQLVTSKKGGKPDWDVLESIAEYCLDYPEQVHHPRENLVYDRMMQRDPRGAAPASGLLAEHVQLSEKAHAFADAIKIIRLDLEFPRERLQALVADYVAAYRRHLEMEEERFFPAAEAVLTVSDWIDLGVEGLPYDPLFSGEADRRFSGLRDAVLGSSDRSASL